MIKWQCITGRSKEIASRWHLLVIKKKMLIMLAIMACTHVYTKSQFIEHIYELSGH